jgi:hypothetical protein
MAIVAMASFAYADNKPEIGRYQLVSGETQVPGQGLTTSVQMKEVYKIDTETGQVWRYSFDSIHGVGQFEPVKTIEK